MPKQQTSFEDRLARIAKDNPQPASSSTGSQRPLMPPPESPRKQRGGAGGGGIAKLFIAFGAVFVVAVCAIGAVVFFYDIEGTFARMAEQSTKGELAGRTTVMTYLMGDDEDSTLSNPVAIAEQRLGSENLSAEEAKQHDLFVQRNKGQSLMDREREGLRKKLVWQATKAKQPAMASQVTADLNACSSSTCLEVVQLKFERSLHDLNVRN